MQIPYELYCLIKILIINAEELICEKLYHFPGCVTLQVLVTNADLKNDETRHNLFSTLSELISLNIVPIINTNDAVTPPPQDDERPPGAKKVSVC